MLNSISDSMVDQLQNAYDEALDIYADSQTTGKLNFDFETKRDILIDHMVEILDHPDDTEVWLWMSSLPPSQLYDHIHAVENPCQL